LQKILLLRGGSAILQVHGAVLLLLGFARETVRLHVQAIQEEKAQDLKALKAK
jgi:hypothetical protein